MLIPTIHTLPPEIILEIFQWHVLIDVRATFCAIFRAAWVCHRWRCVAFENALFWRTVDLCHNDIPYTEVVHQIFAYSGTQPIVLTLDLTAPAWGYSGKEKYRGFLELLRLHLGRASRLEVYADETDWADIIAVWGGEPFAQLDVLIVRCYEDWEVFDDDDSDDGDFVPWNPTAPQAVAAPSPIMPNASNTNATIPAPLFFPLPSGHRLQQVQLYGMSVSDVALPHLRQVSVVQTFPDIVSAGGTLHPLLFNTVAHLELQQISMPPMTMTAHTPAEPAPSPLRTLVLNGLRATRVRDDDDAEHDCRPFFASLPTQELRILELHRFDPTGREWPDFLASLPSAQDAYPCVSSLVLHEMAFGELSRDELKFFLGSFPAMEGLEVRECADVGSKMLEILSGSRRLCPLLRGLLVDGVFVRRKGV
ncbi:hypothetical protein B0H16DRAFT_1716132 [Mycena metata]|uniref:F-box domain-containing protein n=1 Tax=Mycena metata TaxID=1033252 RepID=A0AAD7JP15_9AGAR|nr:hypothetical protein B0H16DRAFT_1716132 [Mycena metata]